MIKEHNFTTVANLAEVFDVYEIDGKKIDFAHIQSVMLHSSGAVSDPLTVSITSNPGASAYDTVVATISSFTANVFVSWGEGELTLKKGEKLKVTCANSGNATISGTIRYI